MKVNVLGSKDFLDMPVGTFFAEIFTDWNIASLEEQVFEILRDIRRGRGCFSVYINNYSALDFGDENRNYVIDDVLNPENHFIWDHNIIGDANPEETLYLVIPEDIIPDEVDFEYVHLTKDEILKIRDRLKDIASPDNDWARDEIKTHYSTNSIVNFNEVIEVNVLK